jgi:hypothetical protein
MGFNSGFKGLNRRGRQFSRLMAAEVCASAVVMLDTPCSEVLGIELATHSIRQFPLHFPCRVSPCAITFQLHSTRSPSTVLHCNGTKSPIQIQRTTSLTSNCERIRCVNEICLEAFMAIKFNNIRNYSDVRWLNLFWL